MSHVDKVSSIKRLLIVGMASSGFFYLLFFGNMLVNRASRPSLKKVQALKQKSQLDLAKEYEDNLMKFLSQIKEEKFYSENKEDGVILSLLKIFNIPLQNGLYVEIGANNGQKCNTKYLRENFKWQGVLFDEFHKNSQLALQRVRVNHVNVLSLLSKHQVSKDIDLLSVDTNNEDFWVIEQILIKDYRPKIVIHEVNKESPRQCVTVPKPAPNDKGDWLHKTRFYGGSVCAFTCLAKQFNYTMVYCESSGENCFWIRNDFLKTTNSTSLDVSFVQAYLKPKKLLRTPPTTKSYRQNVIVIQSDKLEQYNWIKIKC